MSTPEKIIADIDALLPHATRDNSRTLLRAERDRLVAAADAAAAAAAAAEAAAAAAAAAPSSLPLPPPPPPPAPIAVAKADPILRFRAISRYAWDQSAKFVKIYVTLPGSGAVPDDRITLAVEPAGGGNFSLRLDVLGLAEPGAAPNARLAISTLCGAVNPSQCSWLRKPNDVLLLKLRKPSGAAEWSSLDDSGPKSARRRDQDLESNKGKSTQELLAKMYAEADEAGKASLSKAWEEGRSKREARGSRSTDL